MINEMKHSSSCQGILQLDETVTYINQDNELRKWKIKIINNTDLEITYCRPGHLMINKYFFVSVFVREMLTIYYLEDHPNIACYDILPSNKRSFFDVTKLFYPHRIKDDTDGLISKISTECYQKKAAVRQLLLGLEDENSAFSQNGILKDIIILIGKQFAMQYEKILQDQAKMLEQHK